MDTPSQLAFSELQLSEIEVRIAELEQRIAATEQWIGRAETREMPTLQAERALTAARHLRSLLLKRRESIANELDE